MVVLGVQSYHLALAGEDKISWSPGTSGWLEMVVPGSWEILVSLTTMTHTVSVKSASKLELFLAPKAPSPHCFLSLHLGQPPRDSSSCSNSQ